MANEKVEIDVLDGIRPPRNVMEEVWAYWQYLQCSTPHCHGWLWRRHLNDPDWGIRCYVCRREWRQTFLQNGWYEWNPFTKSRDLQA